MKSKSLAIGIILLFIGISVAPSINQSIVTASQENDLVEVTTHVCGNQVYGDTSVMLTRQQYQDLEQYLVDFRARLNQTITRGEAVSIFKEAVVELDKYGLLPRGMSVENAQRLILKRYRWPQPLIGVNTNKNHLIPSVEENRKCLLAGITDNTFYFSPIMMFFDKIGGELFNGNLSESFQLFILVVLFSGFFLVWLSPLAFTNQMYLGTVTYINEGKDPPQYDPATGWIYTKGSNGTITYTSPLYGYQAFDRAIFVPSADVRIYTYGAIEGFTGIRLLLSLTHYFYLGYASSIKLGSEPPMK